MVWEHTRRLKHITERKVNRLKACIRHHHPKNSPTIPRHQKALFWGFGLAISPLNLSHSPKNSLVAQVVKNLPAMWKTRVQSLHREDPLEKGTATHSSVLVQRIPWTEEPGGLQSMGSQRVGHNWTANITLPLSSPDSFVTHFVALESNTKWLPFTT